MTQQNQPVENQQNCACGCAPSEEACCSLECLIQPRFFCGQLLTDADLTQFLHWTESKFRLRRALTGWGVVCGLQVSLDPARPTHVIVQPGQAIDCCGRDLVVCEPLSFDLSDACPKDECNEPGYNRWGAHAQVGGKDILVPSAYEKPVVEAFSPSSLFKLSQALDLYLYYTTQGMDPQVTLGRSACGQGEGDIGHRCENSRTMETVTLKHQPAADTASAEEKRYKNFLNSYAELQAANIARFRLGYGFLTRGEPIKPWLLQRLEAQPMQEFGFVRDWINMADPDQLKNDLHRILFYMGIDALLAWLRCGCPSCSPDDGLLIGRAWLVGPNTPGGDTCRLILVDSHPPYRRDLQTDPCYPTRPGCHNLAQYLWKDWNTVSSALNREGVLISGKTDLYLEKLDIASLAEIYSQMDRITDCDDKDSPLTIQAYVASLDETFGERVVGFGIGKS